MKQQFKNAQNYQIKKTIKFGLSLKELDDLKEANDSRISNKRIYINHEKKFKTHQEFLNQIIESNNKLKDELEKNSTTTLEQTIDNVKNIIGDIEIYFTYWESNFNNLNNINCTKDYYKILAKKACFDPFWEEINKKEEWNKKPFSSVICLRELKNNDGRQLVKDSTIERKQLLINYWNKVNLEYKKALFTIKNILPKFDIEENKPYLIDFNKAVLTYLRLVHEILNPIFNNSLQFKFVNDDSLNLNSEEEKIFRNNLLKLIEDVKNYMQDNGKTVHLIKTTLNHFTANQKPHLFTDDVDKIVEILQIKSLLKNLNNFKNVDEYFSFIGKNKYEILTNEKYKEFYEYSLIEKIQMFKYKIIPIQIQFLLADYLTKKIEDEKEREANKNKLLKIFAEIGTPKSIAFLYSKRKNYFDIKIYPLKPAFDYAWESLANYKMDTNKSDFPIDKCKEFLKTNFQIDYENSPILLLYSQLLSLKENIVKLKNLNYKEEDYNKIIDNIGKIINEIDLDTFNTNNKSNILKFTYQRNIDNIKKCFEQNKNKLIEKEKIKSIEKDLQYIAKLRGSLKNLIEPYKKLTETFKKYAIEFGKKFAELREKMREANEINKIQYFSVIIEKKLLPINTIQDKYLFLFKLNEKNDFIDKILNCNCKNGEYNLNIIKSLTPKTLIKLIKNKGAYKDFHQSKLKVNYLQIKNDWENYKNDPIFLNYLKDCLVNSEMAKNQQWQEFNLQLEECNIYTDIEKELEKKAHCLQTLCISKDKIIELYNDYESLLLPIINQDISTENKELKNQFSKDWKTIFDKKNYLKLHPEINIFFRSMIMDYPKNKRYSRLQLIANLMVEYVPNTNDYISQKQQIKIFNNNSEQVKHVKNFNNSIPNNPTYFIGIDRGLKQLATLCVLNKDGNIEGGFDIYTRKMVNKKWLYSFLEKRNILDLSNLRVETAEIGGNKIQVLVDLSKISYKSENNKNDLNKQEISIIKNFYIRQLQYQMQINYPNYKKTNTNSIINFYNKYVYNNVFFISCINKKSILEELGINKWKIGVEKKCTDYPYLKDVALKFTEMITEYVTNIEKPENIIPLIELDATEELKRGVVANMVGVIAFLIKKYDYNVRIVLEDLSKAWNKNVINKLSNEFQQTDDFKEKENLELAGSGFYHFFEMQLLKKLFKIQEENHIIHLVPAFRSEANYEHIVRRDNSKKNGADKYVNYPFGVVNFVNPKNTSKCCPYCGATNEAKRRDEQITCTNCSYNLKEYIINNNLNLNKNINFKNESIISKEIRKNNLKFITNADENAAYNIALKALINLKQK